jgi:hypothetical protein
MKKNLPGFVFFCLISVVCSGQKLSNVDTGKYSIHLPDYWKPGNKIWQILNDKLPLVCEELKDKELCGDNCNPKYSIEFEMSEPVVFDYYPSLISSDKTTETWEIATLYGFTCYLLLMNERNELLTKFVLVDTNEVWKVKHRAKLISFAPPPPAKIYMLSPPYQSQGSAMYEYYQNRNGAGSAGQTPYSYINNNKGNLSPTQRDMLGIIDDKIRSW